MFNLGFSELVVICVVALVAFGPDKLPELAKTVGRVFRELRRMTSEMRSAIHETVATIEANSPERLDLKEICARLDVTRVVDGGVRPFASPAPGSASAPVVSEAGHHDPSSTARPIGINGGEVSQSTDGK